MVVDVLPVLALSAGIGLGSSWPLRTTDIRQTDRFGFILSPSLDARFVLRRWVALVLQGRLVLLERTSVATSIEGENPVYQQFPNVSVLGLYGVEFRI